MQKYISENNYLIITALECKTANARKLVYECYIFRIDECCIFTA